MGLGVDDDNDPAPENTPGPDGATLPNNQTWGWDGIDTKKARNLKIRKGRIEVL